MEGSEKSPNIGMDVITRTSQALVIPKTMATIAEKNPEIVMKFLEYQSNLHHALIKSNERIELQEIEGEQYLKKQTLEASQRYEKTRILERRVFLASFLAMGGVLSYTTYKSVEPLHVFILDFVKYCENPFLPNWTQYLMNEKSWTTGYLALSVNTLLRVILTLGVVSKKLILLAFVLSKGILQTGEVTAAIFVFVAFLILTMIIIKLYSSNITVTLASISIYEPTYKDTIQYRIDDRKSKRD
jgi:hypothetical protein